MECLCRGGAYSRLPVEVCRTFQNLQIFTELSTLDNVMVAMKGIIRSPLPLVLLGLTGKSERRVQADGLALLELVGLTDQSRIPAKNILTELSVSWG